MASTKWNEIDNQQTNAEDYYCAFIDILGYKEKAEKFFAGEFNLEGRFERATATAKYLFNLSSTIVDSSEIEIKFFSDSIILLLNKSRESHDRLFSLIQFCRTISAHLSYEDLFVRGGISHGQHRESQLANGASFLASTALQKAYTLESKHAINPRILVDQELVTQLGTSKGLLLARESNEYFVHFASQLINSNGENVSDILKEMLDIQTAREKNSDPRVIEKYTWILDYYYWTLSLIPGINMSDFSKFSPEAQRDFKLADSDD